MASLDKKDIKRISELATLTLTDKEIETFAPQLGEVVEYFDQLNEVDTSSTEPTSQTTGLEDVTRADEIDTTRVLSVEQAVLNAHHEHNNYFVVDALLDKSKDKS